VPRLDTPTAAAATRFLGRLLEALLTRSEADCYAQCPEAARAVTLRLALVPGAGDPGNYVQLFFEDNGIGFPQEFAEKVFVMFHRLGTERSGTGIGLALCKKIVENHHGYIRVQSTPGEGSRFDIVLPKRQPVN